ncbi:hypothetical protein GCM10027169_24400 [Gordonia jinhuaensis]|uniref:Uncharacterized protein n=1 Tax=Gordonia jinhuaensis TaxID=1517702 RepID=A0A916WYI3_9ACTN|nr:hypothetical protein GCM10011489_29280 [Gordonia jinhuaensis]
MMKIEDLLAARASAFPAHLRLETDPLSEDDVLQEAQILDVRFAALIGVVGVLFELRQALQLQEASTAVLVARGVRALEWSADTPSSPHTAWSVIGSTPRVQTEGVAGGGFGLHLSLHRHGTAHLEAEHCEFYVVDVPGLPSVPPDYTEIDLRHLDGQVANWDSPCEIVGASRVSAHQ